MITKHTNEDINMKDRRNYGNKRYTSYGNKLKRNAALMVFTLCTAIALSFTFFTLATKAQENKQPVRYKYFTQIEVGYGESLMDIADHFYSPEFNSKASYIQEVRNINSLYQQEVAPGTFLIVPYYDISVK